ncbi:type IV secretion system DNA-binding domain-containing protein [Candidatus Azambacteria bacterium]|nr:type IV secretion system DNA-binding domain-containing protein [Candidatus Azambacteria bacterium]
MAQDYSGYISIFFMAVVLVSAAVALWYVRKYQKKGEMTHALNMHLLLVSVPLSKPRDANIKEESDRLIGICEQFFSSLTQQQNVSWLTAAFSGSFAISFEMAIHIIGDEVHFYAAVPRKFAETLEKQITAVVPGARVEIVDDYNIFNPAGITRASSFKFARGLFLPLKTYKKMESDPLNSIVNAMSNLQFDGEGAAVQILIRPNSGWQSTVQKVIIEMRKGKNFSQAYSEATKGALGTVVDLFGSKKKQKEEHEKEQKALDEETIKALEFKASKVGFDVNINLIASALTETRANAILSDIESAFSQFEYPGVNRLKPYRFSGKKLSRLIYNFSFRNFDQKNKMLFNSEELASIFHFPTPYMESKKIVSLKSKFAQAPSGLSGEGLLIGKNVYRGIETPVRLPKEDRLRHLYIIGQTGTGKSVSLKNMIQQDIENGDGVCFIDPHGDDLEDILTRIPKERIEDVIVFDPSDLQRPVGLNMLEYDTNSPEQKTFIINEMVTIFDKLYDLKATGGPMFEHYLRNALLLIMSDPESGSTLLEVPRVFSDSDFRKTKLAKCSDPLVKNFWTLEAAKAGGEASLANITPYITSKFNVFLANEFVRPIIAQQKSTINFREIIDNKKIFLVNLSKGKIGDINSNLLGLIIVGKITMAALSRGNIPSEKRSPFYLYIDEFQNFATDSIAVILSEARKYKLSLTVAHQFIAQLPEKIRDAIFGNVGSMISFRVGVDDAEFLEKQFAPEFNSDDIMNIDNLNAYVKLLINNKAVKPFNIKVDFPKKGDMVVAQKVKELSSIKYGRSRQEVDIEIEERFKKKEVPASPQVIQPPSELK